MRFADKIPIKNIEKVNRIFEFDGISKVRQHGSTSTMSLDYSSGYIKIDKFTFDRCGSVNVAMYNIIVDEGLCECSIT